VKVAIIHDWLDTWAGGESCLAEILGIFPDAALFALVDFFSPSYRERIGGRFARTSFLQRFPGARARFRHLLPLFPRAIEGLDVASFDLVISNSHAVAKGVKIHADQLHVCYCYSPIRSRYTDGKKSTSAKSFASGKTPRISARQLSPPAQVSSQSWIIATFTAVAGRGRRKQWEADGEVAFMRNSKAWQKPSGCGAIGNTKTTTASRRCVRPCSPEIGSA